VVPAAIPFFLAMALAMLLITYVPELSLWLPRQFGF
jgi:TRAP-type C4-dicarboxylate transport system permease large subunit